MSSSSAPNGASPAGPSSTLAGGAAPTTAPRRRERRRKPPTQTPEQPAPATRYVPGPVADLSFMNDPTALRTQRLRGQPGEGARHSSSWRPSAQASESSDFSSRSQAAPAPPAAQNVEPVRDPRTANPFRTLGYAAREIEGTLLPGEREARKAAETPKPPARAMVPPPVGLYQPPRTSTNKPPVSLGRHTIAPPRAQTQAQAQGEPQKNGRRAKKKKAEQEREARGSEDESGPLLESISLRQWEEGGLEKEIERLYQTQRASPHALAARQELIDQLTHLFNTEHFQWGHSHNSHRNPLVVEPFGSVRFGLATSSSDLDLCLFDPYRPSGFSMKHLRTLPQHSNNPDDIFPQIYNMRVIAKRLLTSRMGFEKVVAITGAGVPIVKFEKTVRGERIQADLNTNERFGVLNSRLIAAYCSLHPAVRPLSVFIKFWARQRQLNDPSGSTGGPITFSSYTIILLVLSYLQHIALLPNLQSEELISLAGVERQKFWSRPKRTRVKKKKPEGQLVPSIGWDTTFVEVLPDGSGFQVREEGLEELARGFFEYYGRQFEFEKVVVSLQRGGEGLKRETEYHVLSVEVTEVLERAERNRAEKEREQVAASAATEGVIVDIDAQKGEEPDSTPAEEGDTIVDETQHELYLDLRPVDPAAPASPNPNRDGSRSRSRSVSRSSSPVPYGEFREPGTWQTQKLVVQDPFILTRNTAQNVKPDVVEVLLEEMRRAADLIKAGKGIKEICRSVRHDEGYLSLVERAKQARKKRSKLVEEEKARLKSLREKDGQAGKAEGKDEAAQAAAGQAVETERQSEASKDVEKVIVDLLSQREVGSGTVPDV